MGALIKPSQRPLLRLSALIVTLLMSVLGGCATARDAHYGALTRAMQQGQHAQAAQLLTDAHARLYAGGDALLLPLDSAMVKLAAGDWPGCVVACEAAKALMDKLYTQHVRDHVAFYVLGDDQLPYVGDPYERVAVHLIEAVAYLAQGSVAEARVEVRAMQETLRRQAEVQGPAGVHEDGAGHPTAHAKDTSRTAMHGGGSISDNAFAYFMAGLLEADEQDRLSRDDDAALDLQRALQLYEAPDGRRFGLRVPTALVQALCGVLQRQNKQGEACALRARFAERAGAGCCATAASASRHEGAADASKRGGPTRRGPASTDLDPQKSGWGKIIVLHLAGEVPAKAEAAWETFTGLQVLRVPYPYYGRPQVASAHLRAQVRRQRDALNAGEGAEAEGGMQAAEQVFDLGLTAELTLRDRIDGIHDRAVARAVAAAVATDALVVGGAIQGGVAGDVMQLVGMGLGITHAATVHADLRSWRTLPNTIELAVLHAPQGPAELILQVERAQGGRSWEQRQQLVVGPAPIFVVLRSL